MDSYSQAYMVLLLVHVVALSTLGLENKVDRSDDSKERTNALYIHRERIMYARHMISLYHYKKRNEKKKYGN